MMNRSAITYELRRYGKGVFKHADTTYEVTGTVRSGYSLWQVDAAVFGPARTLVGTFSAIDELYDYVESER